jgi:aquaporin Z
VENWQKYAAEAYGTFVLVGIGTGAFLVSQGDLVVTAFAFGFAFIAALYTVGRVSGGHFNPAVSLGAFLDQRISLTDMFAYWVAQIAGAVIASFAWAFVVNSDFVALSTTRLGINPGTGEPLTTFDGIFGEALFTLVFVMAVLVLMKSTSYTKYIGMGFTLAAVHFVGVPFTGASVNPARTLGPAIVGGEYGDLAVYLIGPAIGAVLAWVLYKFIVTGDTDLMDDIKEMG